jgi:hypothetical protein
MATATTARLAVLAASGEIGLDEAADLANLLRTFIDAKTSSDIEARMAALEQAISRAIPQTVDITVENGLPNLPALISR